MNRSKNTLNTLRKELRVMTMEQKQDALLELQAQLFTERGREKSHAMGVNIPSTGPHTCWVIRRCIAMIKTSMNMKGFGYHPRKGVE